MNTELFKSEESKLELYKKFISQCTSASSSEYNYSDFTLLDELIKKRYPNFASLITIDDPNELQKIYDDLSKLPSFEEFNGKPNEGKPFKKIGNGQYHNALLTYIRFLKAVRLLNKSTIKITEKPDSLDKQIIFYGAPGTGKSFEVNKRVESLLAGMSEEEREKHKFRTTFHPDSDYASFVGCYKPIKEETSSQLLNSGKKDNGNLTEAELITELKTAINSTNNIKTYNWFRFGIDYYYSLKNYLEVKENNLHNFVSKAMNWAGKSFSQDTFISVGMQSFEDVHLIGSSESKITYSFVPQTFAKAYVTAWKSFAGVHIGGSKQRVDVIINAQNNTRDRWILTQVNGDSVSYIKESLYEIGEFSEGVKKCWNRLKDSDDPQNDLKQFSFERFQISPCLWFKDNCDDDVWNRTADECWNSFLEHLKEAKKEEIIPGTRVGYSIELNDDEKKIKISSADGKRPTKGEIEKYYTGEKTGGDSIQKNIADKLKEYNSQNFGEAWKELEKRVNNSSDQPSDVTGTASVLPIFLIIEEINRGNCAQVFGDLFQLLDRNGDGLSEYDIDADADLEEYIRKELEGCDGSKFPKGVKEGKKLVLPPNLYIWATMNTSDQSLFPMDSAFKRRWSWKYVPIDYSHKDSSKFEIEIDGAKYSWPNFLRKINEEIKNLTYSEDKQMGNFFIKHSIGLDEFRDKVMFYLWSEIGKENYKTKHAIFLYNDGDKKSQEFSFNELYGDEEKATKILKGFMDYIDKKDSDKFKNCSILKSEKKEQNQDLGSTPAVDSDEEI